MHLQQNALQVGIDVGSTTVKVVAVDARTKEVLYSAYVRHYAHQAETVQRLLRDLKDQYSSAPMRAAVCGSGAMGLAQAMGLPFVQEVVANSLAIRAFYPQVRTAIELGGQDAKMIFLAEDAVTGRLMVSDMRMNGSCAGGTGAFIDEIAALLKIPVESFDEAAQRGRIVHDISGRCGVYAKTDIQPRLNQGVPKEDLARSSFHAIAKQTIGGLAQGLEVEPPVIFEGGPLTFNPTLIEVFKERLGLEDDQVIVPRHPETIIALGAALSLDELFADVEARLDLEAVEAAAESCSDQGTGECSAPAFFESQLEKEEFLARHALPLQEAPALSAGQVVRAYLGIDAGSTTTKLVLVDEANKVVDSFYASNEGEPLDVAIDALRQMRNRYAEAGAELRILGVGTTGYGELLFNEAFRADYHVVETVAHAVAAQLFDPEVSFILDIGGQDMKAIWVENGVIVNILVNEACSSGCGSFLENFASSLNVPVEQIAETAFSSKSPAVLGSRCTVFMTSSIVTEQKNGKTSADIMAGLCRSIIENVFTKVIRISSADELGKHIVVQGGTFKNDAVLRAFEQQVGRKVTRAPYPGLMGAIGAAVLTRRQREAEAGAAGQRVAAAGAAQQQAQELQETREQGSRFIGLDALDDFAYEQESNLVCGFCANHCRRTCITFSTGNRFIVGNRCAKGEVLGDPRDQEVRKALRNVVEEAVEVPDLFAEREELLFRDWPCTQLVQRDQVVGLPRALMLWETAPFWTTFWRALGFTVKLSRKSTHAMYEEGLPAVSSDTVCFPAKLVHGHVRDLVHQGVDFIFMPSITAVKSENTVPTSQSLCAVVKGYPLVIRNSDDPERRWGVTYHNPLFHWFDDRDRDRQLSDWMGRTFGIENRLVMAAIAQADAAQAAFSEALAGRGQEVIDQVTAAGSYAVVLASRPYQNDRLVNHDLPRFFTEQGIAVLTVDAVPGLNEVALEKCLVDVANNYHGRMLAAAILAAENPHLEYVQLVSFGCGHDAYLSDEIQRLMHQISLKAPLVLKVDESDIQGPLRIRVRSFVETVNMQRKRGAAPVLHELEDPYHSKFTAEMRKTKLVLVPNTSHAFSMLMASAFAAQGLRTESLPVGGEEAIRLGKRYVHNDICFPCQIVVGEALAALSSGKYDLNEVAVAMGKYVGDCRLTHYAALLRKAMDAAGFEQVPIITNDEADAHDVHPGFRMSLLASLRIAFGLPMIDALEELLRKMRPYELEEGSADAAFDCALQLTMDGLQEGGLSGMKRGFAQGIEVMRGVRYDRSRRRPTVLIVGEYLLNFHPGANHGIEKYLESNGLEVIEARMTDVIRKTYFYRDAQNREYKVGRPLSEKARLRVENGVFELAHDVCDKIAAAHPLYQPAMRMPELVQASDPLIHHTFDAGEGVLIPGEILHHAARGCRNFVILQPFGCLPNHVVGRGICKRLKELYPDAQILPLDYDPDVSFANVENRLQMLIINALRRAEAR